MRFFEVLSKLVPLCPSDISLLKGESLLTYILL